MLTKEQLGIISNYLASIEKRLNASKNQATNAFASAAGVTGIFAADTKGAMIQANGSSYQLITLSNNSGRPTTVNITEADAQRLLTAATTPKNMVMFDFDNTITGTHLYNALGNGNQIPQSISPHYDSNGKTIGEEFNWNESNRAQQNSRWQYLQSNGLLDQQNLNPTVVRNTIMSLIENNQCVAIGTFGTHQDIVKRYLVEKVGLPSQYLEHPNFKVIAWLPNDQSTKNPHIAEAKNHFEKTLGVNIASVTLIDDSTKNVETVTQLNSNEFTARGIKVPQPNTNPEVLKSVEDQVLATAGLTRAQINQAQINLTAEFKTKLSPTIENAQVDSRGIKISFSSDNYSYAAKLSEICDLSNIAVMFSADKNQPYIRVPPSSAAEIMKLAGMNQQDINNVTQQIKSQQASLANTATPNSAWQKAQVSAAQQQKYELPSLQQAAHKEPSQQPSSTADSPSITPTFKR